MQCKTRHSCENNKAQNFHQKPPSTPGTKSNNLLVYAWYQCQPNGTGQNKDSVCRQCCQTDKEYTQNSQIFIAQRKIFMTKNYTSIFNAYYLNTSVDIIVGTVSLIHVENAIFWIPVLGLVTDFVILSLIPRLIFKI